MATLKNRRRAAQLEAEIRAGRTREVCALIDSWGIDRTAAQSIARELTAVAKVRALADNPSTRLEFDSFDKARVLADVWAR